LKKKKNIKNKDNRQAEWKGKGMAAKLCSYFLENNPPTVTERRPQPTKQVLYFFSASDLYSGQDVDLILGYQNQMSLRATF
jgi:hypothetical protein